MQTFLALPILALYNETTAFIHLFFSVIGIISLISCATLLGRWIRPHKPNKEKNSTYESGLEPSGKAIGPFNSRLYIIGCIFILFELEAILLFPWASIWQTTFPSNSPTGINQLLYMAYIGTWLIGLWAIGLIIVLSKRKLLWGNHTTHHQTVPIKGPVPVIYYEKINERYAKQSPIS